MHFRLKKIENNSKFSSKSKCFTSFQPILPINICIYVKFTFSLCCHLLVVLEQSLKDFIMKTDLKLLQSNVVTLTKLE